MKLAAIVCEYNPFHKGHQFHIEETKRITGCDGIVAVMSGNYVQRGEGAIFPKEERAKKAVFGGADLVLELSPLFSVRSAEDFSKSAVKIITSIPEVKYLSFGAEEDNIEPLKRAAEILFKEPCEYKSFLKEELKKGISYPKARENALVKMGEDDAARVLSTPNNILGVEYLKALKSFSSEIEPVLVKRIGAGHDSKEENEFPSATYLREEFYRGNRDFSNDYKHFLDRENFEKMILSRIISMSEADLMEIAGVSEGLENRIKKAAKVVKTLDELSESVKTKRYTMSKIRRVLLCAGLGIRKIEEDKLPAYAKILDFNEKGQRILNTIKKTAEIPIIKNMTALKKAEEIDLIRQYEKEAALDMLYRLYTEER